MLNNEELSTAAHSLDCSKISFSTIQSPMAQHLSHYPNGTLVPSTVPNKMIRITNSRRLGPFADNARKFHPKRCLNLFLIKCHGSSSCHLCQPKEEPYTALTLKIQLLILVNILVQVMMHNRFKKSS
jgi:hypothetical protein